MSINFSNVNISLRQFHEIASGKYNAGDIKLTSETEIDKANNHVSTYMSWRYNREAIGAEEAVAVKEALIKALQRNGFTNEEKINEIRERIGLDRAAGESDVALENRKIKPLSRKEVREIFNANAREINECAKKVAGGFGDVLTNDQVLTQKHHQDLKDKDIFSRSRDAINSENEAKFMKKVVESDRAKLGEDVREGYSRGNRSKIESKTMKIYLNNQQYRLFGDFATAADKPSDVGEGVGKKDIVNLKQLSDQMLQSARETISSSKTCIATLLCSYLSATEKSSSRKTTARRAKTC